MSPPLQIHLPMSSDRRSQASQQCHSPEYDSCTTPSTWALVCEGFLMQNSMLLIVESLIGASGAILTYIMCVAMNRSTANVLFGGYTTAKGPAEVHTGVHKEATLGEVVGMLTEASEVIIVPGYGLAVAQGQYPLAEMVKTLNENGVRL